MSKNDNNEEKFKAWLDAMEPFLKAGNSLRYAMRMCDIIQQKDQIYAKYAQKDWFSDKVDELKASPGEEVNSAFYDLIIRIKGDLKRNKSLGATDAKLLMFYAEHHRSSQPFFVTRTETAQAKPIEEILDELNKGEENKDDVAENAAKQMVETKPLVQDQGQTGKPSDVPPQPDSTPIPG